MTTELIGGDTGDSDQPRDVDVAVGGAHGRVSLTEQALANRFARKRFDETQAAAAGGP
jgi:hypothetical protein